MEEAKAALLLEGSPHQSKRWTLLLFPCLQVCSLGLIFYSFAHEEWLRYCWFRFGLLQAANIKLDDSTIRVNIDHLREIFCSAGSDEYDYNASAELYCPGFCGHMKEMERAGGILLFFMVIAVATGTGALIQHVIKCLRPDFYSLYFLLFAMLPLVSLFIGALVYTNLLNYSTFQAVYTEDLCEKDRPFDMSLQAGSMFAIIALGVQLLATLCGMLLSAHQFRKPSSV
jgi:hypothetical protein